MEYDDSKQKGAGMSAGKTDVERQTDNDAIARDFLEVVKARAVRMGITYEESMVATFYILLTDYVESRLIGDSTFAGEFKSRRGIGGKK